MLTFSFDVYTCNANSPYSDIDRLGSISIPIVSGDAVTVDPTLTRVDFSTAVSWISRITSEPIGNGIGTKQSTIGYYENLSLIAPLMTNFLGVFENQSSKKLKLKSSNGYYAVSTSTISGYYGGFNNFDLYDDNNNNLGSCLYSAFIPFKANNGFSTLILSSDSFPISQNVKGKATYISTEGSGNNITYSLQSWPDTGIAEPLRIWLNGQNPASTDPYDGMGEGEIPGGGPVGIPGFPGLSATSTGIIGLFVPSSSQMQALASYMWTDFGGTGTTVEDVLKEVVEALKRSISNPLDYVVGLNIIPSQGLSIGGSSVIKFGFTSSGVSMPRLSNQYFSVDCGSLYFDTLCGNTFLDYAPYSKFSIYLPYIGVKEVDANDFVGHTIGVVYHGDTVTGGVTAYITKDGSVMYQYSGSCAISIPLTADGWGSTISGAVQIASSLVAAGATGGAAGVGLAAAKGAASVAANPSMLSPQVSRSGAVSGSAGCMGVQYPYVIREAVRFHSTNGFNKTSGYPSFYYRELSNVRGYTVCLNVHLENIPGTQGEIAEIEKLLKEGVIL